MGMLREAAHSKVIWGTLGFFVVALLVLFFLKIPIDPNDPRNLKTRIYVSNLYQAIEGFHSVYGSLPQTGSGNSDMVTEGAEGVQLLTVLLGKEAVSPSMQNKRQILFLIVEETKVREKGGLLYASASPGKLPEGLYDAWGKPFQVRFAPASGGGIPDPFRFREQIHGQRVIVYSYGKDGKIGGGDDIKSWAK